MNEDLEWFRLVLWHTNYSRLFNAKSIFIHINCSLSNSLVYYQLISLVVRVFTNGPGDLGSIPSRVIPKTLKMVLDTSLLNTQQYKVHIKDKVEQSRERNSALPYTFWSPLTTVANNNSFLFTHS